jgi:hypothetical protein
MEAELVVLVDERVQRVEHAGPAGKEAGRVLAERDDVAEGEEGGGLFEEGHPVAFAVAFDGGGEAGESGADYEDVDAGGGESGEG